VFHCSASRDRPVIAPACIHKAGAAAITCSPHSPPTFRRLGGPRWSLGSSGIRRTPRLNSERSRGRASAPTSVVAFLQDRSRRFLSGYAASTTDNLSHGLEVDAMVKGIRLQPRLCGFMMKSVRQRIVRRDGTGRPVRDAQAAEIAGGLAIAPTTGDAGNASSRLRLTVLEGHRWKWNRLSG